MRTLRSKTQRKYIMTKNLLWKTLAPLILLPLVACGQTPVSNNTSTKSAAVAADVDQKLAQALTEKLEKTYQEQKLKVLSIHNTPIKGLYEVLVTGNQLVYVDAEANYMLVGDLLDINSRRSLTEERMAEVNKIDYPQLPLEQAIKEVRGNGQRQIVVFSDPDCPYCKRLEHEFAKMTDLTIYTFLMPIPSLHPRAQNKSEQIWCQSDRTAAWTAWMREGKNPPPVPACANPVAETMALGQQHGFNGTPTLVFPNGKTLSGYLQQAALKEAINSNQK